MKEDIKDISAVATTAIEHVKRTIALLRERRYFAALKEAFNVLRALYKTHLEGKYFVVKGKKIPRTAVAVAAAILLYMFYPSADKPQKLSLSEQTEIQEEMNNYAQDGVKIYDLRKCDNAVCGYLENANENPIKKINIEITFHDQTGTIVYRGGVEAENIKPMSRNKLNIPSEVPFSYMKLSEVNVEK